MKWVAKYRYHLAIFLASLFTLTKFNIDPDLGWHLATGREFLERGRIIWGDEFSWTMPGYIWGNSYFFYQVVAAYVFGHFGHLVTGAVFGILASLAVLVLTYGKKIDFWQFLAIILATSVASVSLGIRPHTISFFMFALLLVFIERRFFEKPKHVLLWFVFFAIWANFHRGFLVGLLVLFSYLGIDFVWRKARSGKNIKFYLLCASLALLGTFITPFSLKLWNSAVFGDLTSRDNLLAIAEWQSSAVQFPISALFALSGAVFIYIFWRQIRKVQPHWFLIAAAIFMFAFVSAAFIFFWWAIFIFLIVRRLNLKVLTRANIWVKLPIFFSTVSLLAILFLSFFANFLQSMRLDARLALDGYPAEAVSFMQEKGLNTKVFNEYGWGGFIDWQAPETLVFIDGRMASWRKVDGGAILTDYLAITRGRCEYLSRYDVKVVLVKKDAQWSCFSNWKQVYQDKIAKVLVKN